MGLSLCRGSCDHSVRHMCSSRPRTTDGAIAGDGTACGGRPACRWVEHAAWDDPKISAALTGEQKKILQERGVLSAEEIHRLVSKVKDDPAAKPACHSDVVSDSEVARHVQEEHVGAEGGD